MPGMILFNRRWRIATDDLSTIPAIYAMCHSVLTATLLAYVIHVRNTVTQCRRGNGVMIGLGLLLAVGLAVTTLSVILSVRSARGLMFEKGARQDVPFVLLACAAFAVAECVMSVVTARLAWSPRAGATCDDALRGDSFERGAIRAITLIQCIFTFLGLALALTYFDPSGSAELQAGQREVLSVGETLELPLLHRRGAQESWSRDFTRYFAWSRYATCGALSFCLCPCGF